MVQEMIFDAIIVGKGLIGSAIGRHLSMSAKHFAIIGPDEPIDYNNAKVFSSHYDSGRVQRLIGQSDAHTSLNIASAGQYPWLEEASGISFHKGCGCLYVNPAGSDQYLNQLRDRAARFDLITPAFYSGRELNNAFPEFSFPESAMGVFEVAPSGYISPPLLIQAQLNVFRQNGGTVYRDTVSGISFRNGVAEISSYEGNIFLANKVVVAAGAFTNFCNLLPRKVHLVIKSETVILAKLGMPEAERLNTLPSLLFEIETPDVEGIYLTPPMRYPDGSFYLKMGCNLPDDIFFGSRLTEIQEWFRNGNSDFHVNKMKAALRKIMPELNIANYVTKRCILPRTQGHKHPYIGHIDESIYIATGDGWSAMCSDGIGYVMANLILNGKFPDGYDAKDYEPVFK